MTLSDITSSPLPQLPPRPANSHKGLHGHALVVGGSRGMSGAITLSGMAALRGGAGLVTLAVPRSIQDVVAGYNPSYMTVGLADAADHMVDDAADEVLALAETTTVVALGPGLGRTPGVVDFVARLYREVKQPMVVDADALVALAAQDELLAESAGPRILTPHPGEFARLTGSKPGSDDQARGFAAGEFASRSGGQELVVVLKGHHTVITDGKRYALNHTGNPGMATGGTGDVLTGIVTALLCQGLTPFDAARLGVHIHGLAGDLAAEKLGQISLIASDLIDYLPAAFLSAVAK
jgi:ADP-dependent NAD(P)H-hydrate dehydratase